MNTRRASRTNPSRPLTSVPVDRATKSRPENEPVTKQLLVIHQYALPRGQAGGTRHVDLLSRVDGWHPTYIAANLNHSTKQRIVTDDNRFRLLPIPAYSGNGLLRTLGWVVFMLEAIAVGAMQRADAYLGSTPQPLAPVAALLLARLTRKPFVLEIRDLWPESIVAAGIIHETSITNRLLVRYERFLYRSADALILVTPGWLPYFRSFGVDEAKLHVVTNGTDLDDFECDEDRESLRQEYGITGFTAVFAGSHGAANGIDLIVDAAKTIPNVNFLLVGSGPVKEIQKERAKHLGIRNIRFMDAIPKNAIPRLLKACDLGLNVVAPLEVLNRGMSPNKLFDYMAAGLPVVSNARIPLQSVIVDDQVGPVTDPPNLASGIERAWRAEVATRARWSTEGRRLVAEKYARSTQARALEQTLNSLVGCDRSLATRVSRA